MCSFLCFLNFCAFCELLTEGPVVVATARDLHDVALDQDRILRRRVDSLRPATLTYFVFMKLARLAIELKITGR